MYITKILKVLSVAVLLTVVTYAQDNKSDSLSSKVDTTLNKKVDKILSILEADKPIEVQIKNLPEKDSFWSQFIMIFIPAFAVAFITWFLTYIPQKNQAFNNTFFELLNQQNEILNRISFTAMKDGITTEYNGIYFFKYFNEKLHALYQFISKEDDVNPKSWKTMMDALSIQDEAITHAELIEFYNDRPKYDASVDMKIYSELERSKYVYQFLYKKHADNLRNYLRHLYHIYKFLDTTRWIYNKEKLVNLIQARLTDSELLVLFYNGLRYQRMKEYIEKYNIVENLFVEDLLNEIHKGFYRVEMKSKNTKHELSPSGKKAMAELVKSIEVIHKRMIKKNNT